MPTSNKREKDAVKLLLRHFSNLSQALADAREYYLHGAQELQAEYNRTCESIQAAAAEMMQTAEKEHKHRIAEAEARYAQRTSAARSAIKTICDNHKPLTAAWSDVAYWQSYTPRLMGDLTLPQSDTLAAPGGIRVGEIKQTGVASPLVNVPAIVPLTGSGHIVITSKGGAKAKQQALKLLRSLVTRIALTFPVMSARFVLIDPLGLGDNFPFKRLPESIRGDTVYSEGDEIRAQMRELTEHIRRVTLKYLASEYKDIESYNRDAKEVVEPYRFLCVADFPAKFDSEAATRLSSLAEKGVRTGVYLIIHFNEDEFGPNILRDFNRTALLEQATVLHITDSNCQLKLFHSKSNTYETYDFIPDAIPDAYYTANDTKQQDSLFNQLLDRISLQAERGAFQGIPFERIAVPVEQRWTGDSREIVTVPVGRSGARDTLDFWLGEKRDRGDRRISAHALVGGRTGYGKTTFFHTLICNLALKYAPDELEMYLLDYKEGVAFSVYADYQLPHARVIAVESERELGLSVLRRIQAEMERRGALFNEATKQAGTKIEDLPTYRKTTGKVLPRILLIIDEFQVLFAEQDMITSRASNILDLLARQGRGFGIHIILGSQSFVAANVAKTTFGQFATRLVLRSPEPEVIALLGPDNTSAAELLERPGEVIYNDDGGRRDRNNPGQIAYIKDREDAADPEHVISIPRVLKSITALAQENPHRLHPEKAVIFRGNEGTRLAENEQLMALYDYIQQHQSPPEARKVKEMFNLREWASEDKPALIWLGEATEIKPHTAVALKRHSRSNLLIVGDSEEMAFDMLASALISLAAFYARGKAHFYIIDLSLKEEEWEDTCEHFQKSFGHYHPIHVRERREATKIIDTLSDLLAQRVAEYDENAPSVFFILGGMHRLSDMRPVPGRFAGARDDLSEYANKVVEILKRGPNVGLHTILWVDSAKTFESYLGKPNLAHFGARIALQMSREDSQYLLGDIAASTLLPKRAILLDDERATQLEKFKPYALPAKRTEREAEIQAFGSRLIGQNNG